MHTDYRKVPYNPKSGKRTLVICATMCIIGFALFFVPTLNVSILGWHPRVEILGGALFFVGLFNMIPAVMMLTPPEER